MTPNFEGNIPSPKENRVRDEEPKLSVLTQRLDEIDANLKDLDTNLTAENLRLYNNGNQHPDWENKVKTNAEIRSARGGDASKEKNEIGSKIANMLWESGSIHLKDTPATRNLDLQYLDQAIEELKAEFPVLNHPEVLKMLLPKLLKELAIKGSSERQDLERRLEAAKRGEGLGLRTQEEEISRREAAITEYDTELDRVVHQALVSLKYR